MSQKRKLTEAGWGGEAKEIIWAAGGGVQLSSSLWSTFSVPEAEMERIKKRKRKEEKKSDGEKEREKESEKKTSDM